MCTQFVWDLGRAEQVVVGQVLESKASAFEGSSNYSLLWHHFSVSRFKQRQMIAMGDMANEPAPPGSPVTHSVSTW